MLASAALSTDAASVILWVERSARVILVLFIFGVFLLKGGKSIWHHLIEIIITLVLGVFIVPSMIPPETSHLIASWNTGGAAGATGLSWGFLAVLFLLAGIVVFIFR